MADKDTKLSIILRTVDNSTAGIRAVNAELSRVTKPVTDFKKALGELREKSGLDDVIGGFKGVGSAIGDLLGKVAMIAGVVGIAVAGIIHLVNEFDDLGKKAERLGVSVDFLAGMRDAAERTGVPIEALDSSLEAFNQNLGQARAGTGRMAKFLGIVSPALLTQLKATKNNAEAFDILAGAMAKVTDPAKRAALAQKTLGDSALAPLFARGPKAIKELRERYISLAGSQEGAVKASEETHEAMMDLKDATDGVKASLVEGLAPALKMIIAQIAEWLQGHREDIKVWAMALGEKLPGAFNTLVGVVKGAIGTVLEVVDAIGGWKGAAIAVAAILAGPLVSAIITLGIALLSTPVGWFIAAIAGIAVAADLIIFHWDAVKGFFSGLWDAVKAKFGWFADVVAVIMLPFIAIPAEIIGHWDGIKEFFVDVWDGITWPFRKAWEIIKAIVDKIVGAAKKAQEVGRALKNLASGNSAAENATAEENEVGDQLAQEMLERQAEHKRELADQAEAIAAGAGQSANAKITVDFANAPKGMRATTDPQNTADVDLNVGYQMGIFAP